MSDNRNIEDEYPVDNFLSCESYEVEQFLDFSNKFKNNKLTFLHLNINGCKSNFDEFNAFLSTLKYQYAIIALTETRLVENTDCNFELDGYNCINSYSKHGLKIYYLKSLKVDLLSYLNFNDCFKETLFARIKCPTLGNIIFGVVYRPHSSSIEQFNASFSSDILLKLNHADSIILTGDLNINLALTTNEVQNFTNLMLESGLFSAIDKVTRYNSLNPANSSIIDHFWCRLRFPYYTYIIKTNISDHYIISLHSDVPNGAQKATLKFRDFSIENKTNLLNDLPLLIEQLNPVITDSNTSTSFFIGWLNGIFNFLFPC